MYEEPSLRLGGLLRTAKRNGSRLPAIPQNMERPRPARPLHQSGRVLLSGRLQPVDTKESS
ncbi:hypothetical protein [uncultured Bilophila sp.]|uniref:hypothetical protein n=1 Tax=uncultured Bilophila sp. TaxID=529385 RepID=UPI002602CC53|nr:hypothetical protein [uncultured Bilophila sp.]